MDDPVRRYWQRCAVGVWVFPHIYEGVLSPAVTVCVVRVREEHRAPWLAHTVEQSFRFFMVPICGHCFQ